MGSNDALLNSGLPRALASFSICSAINGCLNRRTLLIYVISKPLSFALLLFFFFFVHHALNCDLGQRLQVVHKMPQENEQSPCGAALLPLCADGRLGQADLVREDWVTWEGTIVRVGAKG